jgi:hypothetical protein
MMNWKEIMVAWLMYWGAEENYENLIQDTWCLSSNSSLTPEFNSQIALSLD